MKKFLILILSLFLCSCPIPDWEPGPILGDTPWPVVGHDLQHTSQSQHTGPVVPELKWFFVTDTGDYNLTAPVINTDNSLVFGTYGWSAYALTVTGTQTWGVDIYGYVTSPPTISGDGTIYLPSFEQWADRNEGVLTAISSDGSILWEFSESKGGFMGSPAIGNDGALYIGDDEGYFYAVHHSGSLMWDFDAEGLIRSSPAIDSTGNIYFTSGKMGQGYLYCLSPDGSQEWVFDKIYEDILANPAIGPDNSIHFPAGDGYLYAVNSNGTLKWKSDINVKDNTHIAVAGSGNVYAITWDEELYSFEADGTERWVYEPVVDDLWGVMLDADEKVFLSGELDSDSIVLISLTAGGEELWQFPMDENLLMNPDLSMDEEGTIYLGTENGILFAVGEQ